MIKANKPGTAFHHGLLDKSVLTDVVDGIHAWLAGTPPEDGHEPIQTDTWELMSGFPYQGECDEQARFMNRAIRLIGTPGGTVRLIYASRDGNPLDLETTTAAALSITEDLDGDGVAAETDEVLTLVFDFEPPTQYWNAFEGSLEAVGSFYAVWPNYKAPSACELLLRLLAPELPDGTGGEGAGQYWLYVRPNGSFYHYPTELPGPTACP